MGKNLAWFNQSPEQLATALGLPDGSEIYGADWDFRTGNIRIFVEHPDLPEINHGDAVPQVMAVYSFLPTGGPSTAECRYVVTNPPKKS